VTKAKVDRVCSMQGDEARMHQPGWHSCNVFELVFGR
jgi:hypothetical protein